MTGDGIYLGHFAFLVADIFAETGTDENCTDQSGDTADGVNRSGTCEIMEAQLYEPALRVPYPSGFDGVYKQRNYSRINTVRNELGTFCHGTGYDGSGRCTEHKVEYKGGSHAVRKEFAEIRENLKIRDSDYAECVIFGHHQ